MNNKKVHANNAKKEAKKPEPNFALFCGFSLRPLREILELHKRYYLKDIRFMQSANQHIHQSSHLLINTSILCLLKND